MQYRMDGGAWAIWLPATAATSAPFPGEVGHRYGFWVRTWDRVGNERPYPATPDATTHIKSPITKYYYFGGQRVALRQGDVVYYVLSDHLGSTSIIADGGGAVVARPRYLPYGVTRHASGGMPTDYGFTGQREEAGLGLYDYRARYYDPVLRRFIGEEGEMLSDEAADSLRRQELNPRTGKIQIQHSTHWTWAEGKEPPGDMFAFLPTGETLYVPNEAGPVFAEDFGLSWPWKEWMK